MTDKANQILSDEKKTLTLDQVGTILRIIIQADENNWDWDRIGKELGKVLPTASQKDVEIAELKEQIAYWKTQAGIIETNIDRQIEQAKAEARKEVNDWIYSLPFLNRIEIQVAFQNKFGLIPKENLKADKKQEA